MHPDIGLKEAAHSVNATVRSFSKADLLWYVLPTAEAAGFLYAASIRLFYMQLSVPSTP